MNGNKLIQTQTERQLQKLSPQQVLMVRLLELPVVELEARVNNEVIENVALENKADTDVGHEVDSVDDEGDKDGNLTSESLQGVLYDDDDENVQGEDYGRFSTGTYYDVPVAASRSFYDDIETQIAEYDLTDHQRDVLEYLVGSLNEHGFLDHSLQKIEDDLLIYMNIETDHKELEELLGVLHQFDPAGIGARNLQECLLIQLQRMEDKADSHPDEALTMAREIIENYYDLFISDKVSLIADNMNRQEAEIRKAIGLIARLDPSPGRSLAESADDRVQTVIPDFIIETSMDGDISFAINNGNVPALVVSPDYSRQLQSYQKYQGNMNRAIREAYTYTKQKVDDANMFINALRQRYETMQTTMQAIIAIQRDFILSQDENVLKPMTLNDVAKRTNLDISTISRVKNSKYVLLDGHIYPLSDFFLRTRANSEGEAVIGSEVNDKIKAIIEGESKVSPYSDQEIEMILKRQGLNISRRTVAKYRKDLGYPIATRRR